MRPMVPQGEAVDGVIIFTTEDAEEPPPMVLLFAFAPFASLLLSSAEEAKEDMSFCEGFFPADVEEEEEEKQRHGNSGRSVSSLSFSLE